MRENFPACLSFVLQSEGGYVNHKSDPGGATNMGITLRTLEQWRGYKVTPEHVKELTKAEASDIYRAKYWSNVNADHLPVGVDLMVFDRAVHSGPVSAGKALQRACGASVDGIIGPMTLRKVKDIGCAETLIEGLRYKRLEFLQRLKIWDVFGRGWKRRVNKTAAEATRMAVSVL